MGDIAGRKIQTNPDGTTTETYIDISTGQVILDPKDYYVYDYEELKSMGIINDIKTPSGNVETVNKQKLDDLSLRTSNLEANSPSADWQPRSSEDNFGYKSQPKGLGIAAMVPGLIGTVGRGAALLSNANNVQATNSARRNLGLKENGFDTLRGLASDQKGHVADVQLRGSTVPVGLDALDRTGRTQMTPAEARRRAAGDPTFRESTKQESKAAKESFKQTYGESGILGWALNAVQSPLAGLTVSDNTEKDIEVAHAKAEKERARFEKQQSKEQKSSSTVSSSPTMSAEPTGSMPYDPRNNRLSWENFDNIRTKPLNELTTTQLNYAADRLSRDTGRNITVQVGSGGQESKEALMAEGQGMGLSGKKLSDFVESHRTGSTRHNDGGAADVTIFADGKPVSFGSKEGKSLYSDFTKHAVAAGATGVGAGKSYMGEDKVHIGQGKDAYWGGADWVKDSYEQGVSSRGSDDFKSWLNKQRDFVAPIPQARPSAIPSANPATEYSGTKDRRNIAPPAPSIFASIDDNTKGLMSRTLAGEMMSDDPKEANAILSTMVNRSQKYGSVEKAIKAPNQYSTLNNAKGIANMNERYQKDPAKWDGLTSNFLKDPNNVKEYTNYHATYVNPDWSTKMDNSEVIGDHKFGSLREYKTKDNSLTQSQPETKSGFLSAVTKGPTKSSSIPNSSWAALAPANNSSKSNKSSGLSKTISVPDKTNSTGKSKGSSYTGFAPR